MRRPGVEEPGPRHGDEAGQPPGYERSPQLIGSVSSSNTATISSLPPRASM